MLQVTGAAARAPAVKAEGSNLSKEGAGPFAAALILDVHLVVPLWPQRARTTHMSRVALACIGDGVWTCLCTGK